MSRLLLSLRTLLLLGFVGATPQALADPVVTPGNIAVDDSGATGAAGVFVIGDEVVVSWDNSPGGDDNPTVTTTSQVVFDVFGIVSLAADSLDGGVFSVTYFFEEGDGDLTSVAAAVTVTDAQGTTGPVSGLQTFDVSTIPPTVSPGNILIDTAGASGPGDTFRPGDTVVISWDNSATGDDNADVTSVFQVSFDLSALGAGSDVAPDSVAGGVFSTSYTFQETDPPRVGADVSVSVTDEAGNFTGPVASIDTIDFDPSPIPEPAPGLGPWAVVLLLALGWILLRRPRRVG